MTMVFDVYVHVMYVIANDIVSYWYVSVAGCKTYIGCHMRHSTYLYYSILLCIQLLGTEFISLVGIHM